MANPPASDPSGHHGDGENIDLGKRGVAGSEGRTHHQGIDNDHNSTEHP